MLIYKGMRFKSKILFDNGETVTDLFPKKKPEDEGHPFLNYKDFPDLVRIRDAYPLVVEELKANQLWLNWGSDAFDPSGHCKFLSGDWQVCPVYFGRYLPMTMNLGELSEENARAIMRSLPERFPKTTELLKTFNALNFAAFSRLRQRSNLAPHKHSNPYSWIAHVGLQIPAGESSGLKVADQTHIWKHPGDIVVFNDNLIHSAWNDSDEDRIVLYLDFLRDTSRSI